MTALFSQLGSWFIGQLSALGECTFFLLESVGLCFAPPIKWNRVIKQIWFIGWKSMPVICLTGAFTGMVLALQGYHSLRQLGSEAFLGPLVALSLLRELGPVLAALMVTGRAGSSITAQLGIMRINDQIDALELMGLNPMRYLVVPNLIALVVAMPLLAAVFNVVAIFGGYLLAVRVQGLNAGVYFGEMHNNVVFQDVLNSSYKAACFGLVIAWVCCYKGFKSSFGAEGVSAATTQAVVNASVLILVLDYLLSALIIK
ncbi:MAG: MlaE family ABC transporter permease [Chthoniobacteraceae bacterium]